MRKLIVMMVALCFFAFNVQAEGTKEAKIREALRVLHAKVPITSVIPSRLPGLYEAALASGEVLYVDGEGSHFVVGELYRVKSDGHLVNLSEEKKKTERYILLSGIAKEDMIVFPAKGEMKAYVTVFTDVDCFYCRKLHGEMKAINERGIEVRYLAYPRAGAGSDAYNTMASIWCVEGDKRNELMTRAKGDVSIETVTCDNPVMSQWKLGQKMGVSGTPALVMPDGELVTGYVPADKLVKMLGVSD